MTTAAENKDAFIAAYVASRPKTPRGTEHSPEAARHEHRGVVFFTLNGE